MCIRDRDSTFCSDPYNGTSLDQAYTAHTLPTASTINCNNSQYDTVLKLINNAVSIYALITHLILTRLEGVYEPTSCASEVYRF